MSVFSAQDILENFDRHAAEFTFPMLDNGYVYLADCRLSLFADKERWALAIEILGFNSRAGGVDGLDIYIHRYGNCLPEPVGANNFDFIYPVADGPSGPLFEEDSAEEVSLAAKDLRIRGSVIPVPQEQSAPSLLRIFRRRKSRPLFAWELLRSLLPEHREELLGTDSEVRGPIPEDLPLILRLNEWHHPDLAADELPSENETFRMLANVAAALDPDHFMPTSSPNTHWSNWPESGAL